MTQDERLQRAWLSLCGWRVGMVDTAGSVFTAPFWGALWAERDKLPDLNFPANWGHWLAWAVDWVNGLELKHWADGDWQAGDNTTNTDDEQPTPAHALLRLICEEEYGPKPLPPAVLDWWRHEQEGGTDE